MRKITDYKQVLECNKLIKEAGNQFYTNFYLSKKQVDGFIANGTILYIHKKKSSLFIIDEKSFYRLYYSANCTNFLTEYKDFLKELSKDVVLDIISKDNDFDIQVFKQQGFKLHKVFKRMTQTKPFDIAYKPTSILAKFNDKDKIEEALTKEFDIFAEHLPKKKEIDLAINEGKILLEKNNSEIAALLMFENIGFTSILRYWYVNSKFRGQGYGGRVFKSYITKFTNIKRFTLWVDEKNSNAIEKYKHYNYKFDGLIDYIFVKNNEQNN